ncbi:MAG: type II secretion system F family protein [Candidatus Omnitrophica bacterium]|nr:type II secretion system F family protein [Candidatus Omnitrophota bacterium]
MGSVFLFFASLSTFFAIAFFVFVLSVQFTEKINRWGSRYDRLGLSESKKENDQTTFRDIIQSYVKQKKQKNVKKRHSGPSKQFYLAGYDTAASVSAFVVIKWVITWALVLAFTIGMVAAGLDFAKILVLNIFIIIGCMFVMPTFYLRSKANARLNEIRRHLADTIDLLIICLEAGLGFDAALLRVAQEQRRSSQFISKELFHTNQEILAGLSREAALRNLAERCGNQPDMQSLVAVIIQAEKIGASVAKTLRTQKDSIRFKRRQSAQEAVMKLPVKLAFPLIFFIFPPLILIILGPAVIQFAQSMFGAQ